MPAFANTLYLNLPYNRITHITFYTQSKRLLLTIMHCSFYKIRTFSLGRSAASHSLMHFINRYIWKSSHYYIIISMMTSFMRMYQKLEFHQRKCISAINSSVYSLLPPRMYPRLPSCICVFHVTAMHA